MQDGNPGQDLVCGRCKQKIEMAVRTEAVYQDEMWFHTACHRAGADQLFRATRLAAVLKEAKRGVETRLSHKNFTCLSNASNLLGQSAKSSSAS
jgi:hypothetical protein